MADVVVRMEGGKVYYHGRSLQLDQPNALVPVWTGRGGLSQEKVDRILNRHEKEAGEKSAQLALRLIRQEIPRATGRTARTFGITKDMVGDRRHWAVGSGDDNAIRLSDGTGLYGPRHHVITRRDGGFFKFPDRRTGAFKLSGEARIRAGVRHPGARYTYTRTIKGMRPSRYLQRAALAARPLVIRFHKDAARAAAMELRLR